MVEGVRQRTRSLAGRSIGGVRRRLDEGLAALGERSARRVWPQFPHSIRLDHPPTARLEPRYGFGHRPHAKLEAQLQADVASFRATLEGFAPYFDDLAAIPMAGESSSEPCWLNPWIIGLDTVSLYAFVRSRQPGRYVEIGSGQSTKVVARAVRDGAIPTTITSIDPHPRSEVDQLCDRVVRLPLEEVDLEECFGGLSSGDMVFFDGSHRVLPNSDCVAFFLDILPNLAPGVLVGIHDIYLPEDYPTGFITLWWSEQYLLAALLLGQPAWLKVVLPTFYVSGTPDLARTTDPLFGRPSLESINRRGSSFWLETG